MTASDSRAPDPRASASSYDVQPVRAPRLAGRALRAFTRLVERPVAGKPFRASMRKKVGLDRLSEIPAEGCTPLRTPFRERPGDRRAGAPAAPADLARIAVESEALATRGEGFRFESVRDFRAAYLDGRCTPVDVARSVIEAIGASEEAAPAMRLFIAQDAGDLLEQAEASAERWRRGRHLGVLDGVPVAVKDEVDMPPYPTTVGTKIYGAEPAADDATAVARLRAAGALLIGKTNMQEIGLGVTGINPHHGAVRNPYDDACFTGGSSSGSAAAVGAGICPIALGADGGGSIRIPASLCGVVGLKPTWGRVSEHGAAPLCWSVAHLGPLAATVADAAVGYALMAGPDPADPATAQQPPLRLDGLPDGDLSGLRLGVYRPWLEHADPEVVGACASAIDALRSAGAVVEEIEIPELELVRLAHLVIIATEMANTQAAALRKNRSSYGFDTRLNLALAAELSGVDYVHALRLRGRLTRHFEDILDGVHGILTPTTGCTAQTIRPDALSSGESDLVLLDRIMRFAPAANLTGLPAVTVPVGCDARGLPIGLQILGRAWQEHVLLRVAAAAERAFPRARPRRHYPVLERARTR